MKRIHPQTVQRHAIAVAVLAALVSPTQAADWEISGFLRQELAYKITDDQNPTNQGTSFRNADKPIAFGGIDFGPAAMPYVSRVGDAAYGNCTSATGCLRHPKEAVREIDTNWFATRLDLNIDGKINDKLKATIKLRGVFDETKDLESDSHGFNIRTGNPLIPNPNYNSRDGDLLSGSSFKQKFGGTAGGPLAYATDRMSLDLPAFYLDYNDGPLWVRAGNQQIAWGEALFFRVADQVNGLDLRGHLFGVAAEEYSDTRRSSLGVRMNYRVNEKMDIDTYVQKFSPTLVPQGETPYGLIPDAFTIDEKPGYDSAKNKLNAGFRVKGEAGGFGYQAFAMSRVDPNGVYKWSIAKDGIGADNGAYPGSAATNTNTGVWSFNDWTRGAIHARLNPIQGVGTFASAVFPSGGLTGGEWQQALGINTVASLCGATTPNQSAVNANVWSVDTKNSAKCVVDTFAGLGPVRGWLDRQYMRENIFGGGINRVFEGEPDSFMDQLIGRFEFSYTPNKKFTNSTLGDYIEANEYQFAFIAEKYHKFVSSFPATYFVLQWLHKSESDLFGRHLSGYDQSYAYNYLQGKNDGSAVDSKGRSRMAPAGKSGGSNAVALALQQPSPTLEYRFDFAILTDGEGGWYSQPGMKWKPKKNIQVDAYLNLVYSQNKGQSKDFADGLQHNNEIFARVAYQF
jgi:hypothetical protein